ncbi:MAG: ATP synthase F0 subunit B [Kofleriaceae bacterium]
MHQDFVSLAAHPLIDIDLTVVIQFALFLIMFAIGNAFLFQPYLKLRERRKEGIDGARAEAEKMSAQADAELADYEKKLAQARSRANDEGRKVRAEAAAHEKSVTDASRAESQKALEEASKKMKAETDAARLQLLPQANALAKQLASKLLGREVA